MDSALSSAKPSEKSKTKKFIRRVILPAVFGKACPICLRNLEARGTAVLTVCFHAYCLECIGKWSDLKRKCPLCNSTFDSWFYKIDISSSKFLKQQLPPLSERKPVIPPNRSTLTHHRRTREEINGVNWRTRPLPWRRSFGRSGTVPPHVITERKLQWRASVYNRRLQAVPISPRISSHQNIPRNDSEKERILQRIEPWIRRELEAILGDPDTSIIFHVVSSLFFSRPEGKPRQFGVEDDFLAPLKPYLHDQTNMFWHELRCFAESSFTMETYDTVVEYRRLE
ncbi:hypothetical protein DITRI_Ditri08aG0017300 [Diplodiscus trichospermus]